MSCACGHCDVDDFKDSMQREAYQRKPVLDTADEAAYELVLSAYMRLSFRHSRSPAEPVRDRGDRCAMRMLLAALKQIEANRRHTETSFPGDYKYRRGWLMDKLGFAKECSR